MLSEELMLILLPSAWFQLLQSMLGHSGTPILKRWSCCVCGEFVDANVNYLWFLFSNIGWQHVISLIPPCSARMNNLAEICQPNSVQNIYSSEHIIRQGVVTAWAWMIPQYSGSRWYAQGVPWIHRIDPWIRREAILATARSLIQGGWTAWD